MAEFVSNSSGVVAHDWIETYGGAEVVLENIVKALRVSEIRPLWSSIQEISNTSIKQSWLAKTPLKRRKALSMPFMPHYWSNMKSPIQRPDWILASSHLFAHMANFPELKQGFRRLAYVHTPARYVWARQMDRRGGRIADGLAGIFRGVDREKAASLDSIAVNSEFVGKRVNSFWKRDYTAVIYPPVEVKELGHWDEDDLDDQERFFAQEATFPKDYLVCFSRLVSYKRLDLALLLAQESQMPIVVVGDGPERNKLERQARDLGIDCKFTGYVPKPVRNYILSNAYALIYPGIEDFGIVPPSTWTTVHW